MCSDIHDIEKQIAFDLARMGLNHTPGIVVRLHPRLHDLVLDRFLTALDTAKIGDGVAIANHACSRGSPTMPADYQFVQIASLRAHTIPKQS